MRWQPLLAEIRALKLSLARLDPRAGMPVQPPPGAPLRAIDAVERRIGRPLPPSYRELLAQHDGLPNFYQGAALLGARPLTRGTYVDLVRISLETELCPFGIDGKAETIFAWDISSARADGEMEVVIWMNEIGERVPSFPAFLELVRELLSAEVAERQRPVNRGSRPRAQIPALAGIHAA
jgi:hypothetical protein